MLTNEVESIDGFGPLWHLRHKIVVEATLVKVKLDILESLVCFNIDKDVLIIDYNVCKSLESDLLLPLTILVEQLHSSKILRATILIRVLYCV